MNGPINTYELIEKYCLDLMDDREKLFFEMEIEKNPALKSAVYDHKTLMLSFEHMQDRDFIHSTLDHIHSSSRSNTDAVLNQLKLHVNKYWKTASVAASVAFMASILTFMVARNVYQRDNQNSVIQLKGYINNIEKEQKKINNEIAKVKKKVTPVPVGPSKFTGTSFALTQNGYIVTNFHVIDGYSKIFTFTSDNVGHQTEVVATDEENDLAILKITESDFKFDSKIPYSIKKSNPSIAQRIYSLGFPKEDIVYNEGYISSTTGFQGDSSHYQLELPSSSGMSGSPIVDESGNIVGIISDKLSQSEGITFAVKSKALINLFKKLPKDFNRNEIASNQIKSDSRSNQIKKIQPFVCVVKVYND